MELQKYILTLSALQALIDALARERRVIGPTVDQGAIVYDDVRSLDDLPRGMTDVQTAAAYRLEKRADEALFSYTVGPQSPKKYFHPPHQRLWRTVSDENGLRIEHDPPHAERLALLGVRACELSAIAIQDRVLRDGDFVDTHYRARRADVFVVAVNCSKAGGTCFCASMGTGPAATTGFDLALTELAGEDEHSFVAEVGSAEGTALLSQIPCALASPAQVERAAQIVERTSHAIGRVMPAAGLREILQSNPEHPRWGEVASRCLSCANCTLVCPTCFCTSVDEATDLHGVETARTRRWDSCFNLDFSYVHGGSVRQGASSRYRQWMTHKLANWFDQFGTSGCVGCGRCITWCPVGIDITEEARAICESGREEGNRDGNA